MELKRSYQVTRLPYTVYARTHTHTHTHIHNAVGGGTRAVPDPMIRRFGSAARLVLRPWAMTLREQLILWTRRSLK